MFIPNIPENSLKSLLEEITYIAEKLEGKKKFVFYNAATEQEIKKLEDDLQTKLPESYKEFLEFSNGARLCNLQALFLSTSEIIDNLEEYQDEDEEFPDDYIIIADLIGDGEVLCFSKKTGKFISFYEDDEEEYETLNEALVDIVKMVRDVAEEIVEL